MGWRHDSADFPNIVPTIGRATAGPVRRRGPLGAARRTANLDRAVSRPPASIGREPEPAKPRAGDHRIADSISLTAQALPHPIRKRGTAISACPAPIRRERGEGPGESALRAGIAGLESLFNPDYEANQIRAAMAPGEAEYVQNIAGQQAAFGGAGQLGSARQALAGQQMAGSTAARQAATAAQVQKDIAAQRAAAATTLAGLGQAGLGQALGAAGTTVSAAMTPQQLYNHYASVIFGTPQGSWSPNFAGTQGQTSSNIGFGLKFGG